MKEEKDVTLSTEINAVLDELVKTDEEIRHVSTLDEAHLMIDGVIYTVVENYREGLDIEALNGRYNELFSRYDYIVGDWGFDLLRLKGFYHHLSPLATQDKDIAFLQEYLYEYCNFGCKYFVIERDPAAQKGTVDEKASGEKRTRRNGNRNSRRKKLQANKEVSENVGQTVAVSRSKAEGTTEAKANVNRHKKRQANRHKEANKTTKQDAQTDFGLKKFIPKESLKQVPSKPKKDMEQHQQRSFSMKEVGQGKQPKTSQSIQAKGQVKNKNFQMREKPQKKV